MTPSLFALFTRSLRDDTRSRAMVWARSGMAVAILFGMLQFHVSRMRHARSGDIPVADPERCGAAHSSGKAAAMGGHIISMAPRAF